MAKLNFLGGKAQLFDDDGDPLAGGKVYFYEPGTVTAKDTYTTSGLTTANANPVVLDANGRAAIWLNGNYKVVVTDSADVTIDTEDNINPDPATVTGNYNLVDNGSFEDNALGDDKTPDGWTLTEYSGSTVSLDTSDQRTGAKAIKFTSTGSGGGFIISTSFFEVSPLRPLDVSFLVKSSVADVRNLVEVVWYDSGQVEDSTTTVFDESSANPTDWARRGKKVNPPSTARYAKIRMYGCHSSDSTSGSTWYDDLLVTVDPRAHSDAHVPTPLNPNSDLNVWQEGTSATAETDGEFAADNWVLDIEGTTPAALNWTRETTAARLAPGAKYGLLIEPNATDASIATDDLYSLVTFAEGYDCQGLQFGGSGARSIVIDFWAWANAALTLGLSVRNSGNDRCYATEFSLAASTLTHVVKVINGDTTGTWDTTNGAGLKVAVALACGADFQQTPDAWAGTAAKVVASDAGNQSNFMSDTSNDLVLSQFRVYEGGAMQAWAPEPFQPALDRCARLFQKSYALETAPGTATDTGMVTYRIPGANTALQGGDQRLSPRMRATPTMTIYSPNGGNSARIYNLNTTSDVTVTSVSDASDLSTGWLTLNAAQTDNHRLVWHYTADARLGA